jgi:DNA repair exonuclease SbcCD nuclease subunit
MGDFMENAIIGSKSDIYLQTTPPNKQVKEIVKLLSPIKDKCLFLIPGNHEQRSFRLVGLHPDAIIAAQLMVPYIEYSALAMLDLRKSRTPRSFLCYFHHSTGGGYTAGGKINAAAKLRLIVPTADATFSGHSHTTSRSPVTWYDASYKHLLKRTGYDYIIGSALGWKGSYAEERAKRPSTVEQIVVTFAGTTNGSGDNRRQTYEIIQPD